MFINRQQAGSLLAKQVAESLTKDAYYNQSKMIVLGLPRGGVPVALELALELNVPLNVITSKKIGAPDQPELAIGAVTADGMVVIDAQLKEYIGISNEYIEKEKQYLANKTKKMEQSWRELSGLPTDLNLKDRQVIVVDDGVATGMTAIAAGRSLRQQGVDKSVFAAPVMSKRAYEMLLKEYDRVIAVQIPEDFHAVGQFYIDFGQTADNEVINALTLAQSQQHAPEVSH